MMELMNDKRILTEQNLRLAAAYYRMPIDGKKALYRLVRQLAEIDQPPARRYRLPSRCL
jgi:hypothetical protein